MSSISKILLLASLGLATSYSYAQEWSRSFGLKELYERHNINFKNIKQVNSVSFPERQKWFRGIIGDVKDGQIEVEAISDSGNNVSQGLRFSVDNFGMKMQVAVCQNRNQCSGKEEISMNKGQVISLDGSAWKLRVYSNPCKDGDSCEVYIPSWALEIRRLNKGAMIPLPKVISVISHSKGLGLYSADQGKFLFNLNDENFKVNNGILRATRLNDHSTLIYNSKSAYFMDWLNDKIVRIDRNTVSMSSTGLSGVEENRFNTLLNLPENSKRKFLGLNEKFIVYNDKIISWKEDKYGSFVIDEIYEPKDSENIIGFTSEYNTHNILVKKGSVFEISSMKTISDWKPLSRFSYKGKGMLQIFGDNLFQFGGDGLKVVHKNKLQYTSLSKSGKTVFLSDKKNAFVQYFSDDTCSWEHYTTHDKHPTSFKGSGVKISCGSLQGFSGSKDHVTLTSFLGSKVTVKNLKK